MKLGVYQDIHHEMLNHWCVNNVVWATNTTSNHSAFSFSSPKHPEVISADVVIFYRTGHHVIPFMKQLRAQNKKVGYFIDDYLWDPQFIKNSHGQSIKPFAEAIDFFLFPNEELEKRAKEVCSIPAVQIHPGIDLKTYEIMANRIQTKSDTFNILVTKGHTTAPFLDLLKSVFNELKNLKRKIRVIYFQNENIDIQNTKSVCFERLSPVKFSEFYSKLASINIDMILNPANSDPFTDCKSPLKFMESASLKVPLLTGRVAAYKKMTDFENILFASSPDEFISKILWAIEFPEKAQALAERSRTLLLNNFMIHKNISKCLSDIEALTLIKKEPQKAKTIVEKRANEQILLHKSIQPQEQINFVRNSPQKCLELSERLDLVCMPVTFQSFIEIELDIREESISSVDFFGATYGFAIKNPIRFDIFHKNKTMHSGFISPAYLNDNSWWPVEFPKLDLDGHPVKIRLYNMDRRPVSFYLAKNNTLGQRCSVKGTITEPIAVRIF
jgi:hypothetical protein